MRFAVLSKGVLRGMGREVGCELLATKTVLPEASRAVYSHCAIIEAPTDLPDGDYEVEFAGEVAVTSLHHGNWVVGRILPHTYTEAAAFYAMEAPRPVEATRAAAPPTAEFGKLLANRPKTTAGPEGS